MREDTVLETRIREPSMTAGEVEMLMFGIDRSRAQFAWKVGGLDAEALNARLEPSTMTLGGLLKHLAFIEDWYVAQDVTGEPLGPQWDAADFDADRSWDWHSAADDSPQELYALWRGAVERSREAWTRALADGGLDQPSKRVLPDGESPNLRRVLVDLYEEYTHHVGHADLLRESIDGLVGLDPPQPDQPD